MKSFVSIACTLSLVLTLSSFQIHVSLVEAAVPTISGELKKWHKVTLTFDGPSTHEAATPNPFRDYRLNVTFRHPVTGKTNVVPGYYAADGDAANTGATSGNKWRVHFAPDEEGIWEYVASFRTGADITVSSDPTAGVPDSFDGAAGFFDIEPTDKTGRDHRGKGLLRYVGEHYMQFAENGEYFIKGGPDDPENFLSYTDFDQTPAMHSYDAHVADWSPGDPIWRGSKGKGIIGALNYISGKGMNSVYFLTLNIEGDFDDVWPYISRAERYRFDCSKLDQWEIVFSHMDEMGILLHVVHQEEEMDQLLDGGNLGVQRKLYYRELIARFSHHLAITWNLGEENTNSSSQVKQFSEFIKTLDPYKHPIVMHTFPKQKNRYGALLGFPFFDGASLQHANSGDAYPTVQRWVTESAASGRKWIVTNDEQGQRPFLDYEGEPTDSIDLWHDRLRKVEFWPVLMAGGAGIEWYLGRGTYPVTDWHEWEHLWDLTRYGLEFFQQHLPFVRMKYNNDLVSNQSAYTFAKEGQIYAIYLPDGGTADLDLGVTARTFEIRWYNPRAAGPLQNGTITSVTGPGPVSIGFPPADASADWIALIRSDELLADAGPDQSVSIGKELTVDGRGSFDPNNGQLAYSWDFGDGNTADGAAVTYSYTAAGTYTATLTVSDGNVTATDSAIIVVSTPAEALFAGTDATTQGDWKNTYGSDGYILVNYNGNYQDVSSLPSHLGSYSYSGRTWVWTDNTSDRRALAPISGKRKATTAYSSRSGFFSLNLDAVDNSPRTLALYFVDWDSHTRRQTITIYDALTNDVLDRRTLSNFNGGIYYTYTIQGSIRIEFTHTAGFNAVLSGVFWQP